MTLHSEIESNGCDRWRIISRAEQISRMISKALDYKHNCRLLWWEYYRISHSTGLNKSNYQKVVDIKTFLQQCEYAYNDRYKKLMEELKIYEHKNI